MRPDRAPRVLRLGSDSPYRCLVGVGGIGAGILFALEGNHDLGRNESRLGRLLDVRDYCKLHIVAHYPAVLLGARKDRGPFHVLPVGKVGVDEVGRRLRTEMERAGMDVRFVDAVPGRPTLLSVCFQYPDGGGGNLTTVDSAAALVGERDVDLAERWLSPRSIALAAPEVPLAVRLYLLRRAGEKGALRAASLATAEVEEARATGFLSLVDLLALNEDEAAALAGAPFAPDAPEPFLRRVADAALALRPGVRLVVTAGARGAFAFDGAGWTHVPALPVPVASTAGAGDAFLGGLLAGVAAGLPFAGNGAPRTSLTERPLASALDLAALVAAYKVTSPHTIPPDLTLDTLLAFAREQGVAFGEGLRRLIPPDEEHGHVP
jgi:sugar/nucleoside kinase (ribokinase family)